MATDIKRLHDVIEGRRTGRGCGKTFARCHQIAGLVEVGEKVILFQVNCYRDQKYTVPMLRGVFEEHGLEFIRVNVKDIRSGNSLIRFVLSTCWDMKEQFAGITGAIVSDLRK